jgi:hypothetical protein
VTCEETPVPITTTDTETTDVTVDYVVGAGSYAWRIAGHRLDRGEAETYLRQRCGMSAMQANDTVDLARIDAVHAVPLTAEWDCWGEYRVCGGPGLRRPDALDLLMREYRRTPGEARELLDTASIRH